MLGKVIIENGVKKIQALTADTGTGAPVGSYLYLEKKSNPQGYLYCDGSTFDETAYPALYQYLGTNVLPDWRELGAKGAEKNTTLIFDSTETDPSTGQAGTQNHDVFTQGEFKDDQLQDHHSDMIVDNSLAGQTLTISDSGSSRLSFYNSYKDNARIGTTTRGKSRAVFIYIKATSGLTENQQENVLNTINENNSYSTEEHATGKKWIDGKPIYRRVFSFTDVSSTQQVGTNLMSNFPIVAKQIIKLDGYACRVQTNGGITPILYFNNSNTLVMEQDLATDTYDVIVIVEYTKTTDN